MMCHRKSKAIETIMISTATMMVIGGRFIIQVCTRNQSDVTPEFRHSQTDPVLNFSLGRCPCCQFCNRPGTSWSSISRPRRPLGDIALALLSRADEVIE